MPYLLPDTIEKAINAGLAIPEIARGIPKTDRRPERIAERVDRRQLNERLAQTTNAFDSIEQERSGRSLPAGPNSARNGNRRGRSEDPQSAPRAELLRLLPGDDEGGVHRRPRSVEVPRARGEARVRPARQGAAGILNQLAGRVDHLNEARTGARLDTLPVPWLG